MSLQFVWCYSPTADKWLEVLVNICALRDMETTGELVRELLTHLDDGALEKKLLDVFGAVTYMDRADVVALPTGGPLKAQQITGVQQNGVQRVDPYATGHEQQIHRGLSR